MEYRDIEITDVPEGMHDRGGDIRLRLYEDGEYVLIRNDYPEASSESFASSEEAYRAYRQSTDSV